MELQTREEWDFITESEQYVPTSADIGRCLRIECSVVTSILSEDGFEREELLVGPACVCTEAVLAHPSIATERPRKTPSGEVIETPAPADSSILRVVSYNILAEIYATKMVKL